MRQGLHVHDHARGEGVNMTGDWARVHRIVRQVAHRVTAHDYPSWREDVEQELLARAAEVGPDAFLKMRIRWEAINVIREWFGRIGSHKLQGSDYTFDLQEAMSVPAQAIRHEGFIAWHRLREAWANLTPNQRTGIYCVLTDTTPTEAAEETGANMQCIDSARRSALARIDAPGAYAKKARDYRDATTKAREALRARRARMKAQGIKRDRSKG